jgi:signal transduction histidine kinase
MYEISIIVAVVASLLLALLTYRKDPSNPANRSFALLALLVALSTLTYPLVNINYENELLGLIVNRMQFVIIFTFGPLLYVFFHYFPIKTNKLNTGFLYLAVSILIIIDLLFLITPLGISEVINLGNRTDIERGPLYFIGVGYVLALSFYTLVMFARKYYLLPAAERVKARYVYLSFVVLLLLVVAISVAAPLLTGTTEISSFGFISFIPWLAIISFAILRHRLFDIRFIFGTAAYYVLVSLAPYSIFFMMAYIYTALFDSVFNPYSFVVGFLVAVAFVVFFVRFNTFLREKVATRLINPGYDPFEVVDSLGKKISTKLDISQVSEESLSILKRTIRADFEALHIIEYSDDAALTKNIFSKKSVAGTEALESLINIVYVWREVAAEPIVYDELKYIRNTKFKDVANWLEPVEVEMKSKRIRIIVPIKAQKELLGLMVLGEKDGDRAYTIQDINLLTSIASTVGLAMARSLFYEEIKQFNEQLQRKVEEATANLRNQNEELEIAFAKLQRLRQQEQDMIDILGHELRTPITVVRNALAFLQKDFTPDQHIDPKRLGIYIDRALQASRRELVLIETLLAATKIDANRVQLKLESVEIERIKHDTLVAHEPAAQERKLFLEFEIEPHLADASIYADKVRTQEVVDNFISNAVKYTMEGGVKVIITEASEKGTPMIKISVVDTGIGIPEEDIEKLGRKFFRARQFIKENNPTGKDVKVSGTGLGLYVSFELIKMMNGHVEVKSKVGQGSEFNIYLPKYVGQEVKNIDQTFNEEEEDFDKMMLERIRKEREELLKPDDKQVTWNLNEQEGTTRAGNMKRLTSANDIISKINTGRKYLETKGEDEQKSENSDKEQQEVDPETEENEENRPNS